MPEEVASNLVLTNSSAAYTRAISKEGANAVEASVVVKSQSSSTGLDAVLQEGNDLQNWSDAGTLSFEGVGSYVQAFSGVASRYVRLKFAVRTGSGTSVIEATLNATRL